MESKHSWWNNISIKESGRRLFILTLVSILVYATLIMWMNFSPYLNLWKVKEIRSTPRILQILQIKGYYSFVYLALSFDLLYSKVYWINKSLFEYYTYVYIRTWLQAYYELFRGWVQYRVGFITLLYIFVWLFFLFFFKCVYVDVCLRNINQYYMTHQLCRK